MKSAFRQHVASRTRLLMFAAGTALTSVPMLAQDTPRAISERKATVAVVEFDNGAMIKRNEFDGLVVGVQILLTNALATNRSIELLERQRMNEILKEHKLTISGTVDPTKAAEVGKVLGVHHIVLGGFVVQPDMEMRLAVRVINTETSVIEYTEVVGGKGDKIFKLIDELSAKINAGLKLPGIRDPQAIKLQGLDGPNQLDALRALAAARRMEEQGDYKSAAALYQKSLQLNSTLGEPRVRLAMLEKRTP